MTDLSLREQIADIVVSHTGHALNGLEYSETDAADAILELLKKNETITARDWFAANAPDVSSWFHHADEHTYTDGKTGEDLKRARLLWSLDRMTSWRWSFADAMIAARTAPAPRESIDTDLTEYTVDQSFVDFIHANCPRSVVSPAPREVTVQEAALYVCPDDDSALNYLESAYGNDLRCAVSCMLDALRAQANEEQSDG